jgi:hypothetical protein
MALDIIFRSLAPSVKNHDNSITPVELASLAASDPTEAQLFSAQAFLEAVYGDPSGDRGRNSRAQTPVSRAQTPMTVWNPLPQNIGKEPQQYAHHPFANATLSSMKNLRIWAYGR